MADRDGAERRQELAIAGFDLQPEGEAEAIFASRVNWLIADSERDKVVYVRLGDRNYEMPSSGPDARFSEQETRILGETMAHEVGHYIGLFHPVEMTWDLYDMLDDTPECASEQECSEIFRFHLMFPLPVCSPLGVCAPQTELTEAQSAVANGYVGVD